MGIGNRAGKDGGFADVRKQTNAPNRERAGIATLAKEDLRTSPEGTEPRLCLSSLMGQMSRKGGTWEA